MGASAGCCSSPNQTHDVPIPAANGDFINWCFDALEENIVIDLTDKTLSDVFRRCEEIRDQAKQVEFEKIRSLLPHISAEKVREAEGFFSPGSVWIGKIKFEGESTYLEIIIGKSFGTGRRVVDFNNDKFARGIFLLTAEVDVSRRITTRKEHESNGFKIVFKWQDEGDDFRLKLLSDNFDIETRMLSGTAIINKQGAGTFELFRAISGKSTSASRSATSATVQDYENIEDYSILAMKKSLNDLQGTSAKSAPVLNIPHSRGHSTGTSASSSNLNFMKITSRDGDDISLDGYAYE